LSTLSRHDTTDSVGHVATNAAIIIILDKPFEPSMPDGADYHAVAMYGITAPISINWTHT